MAMMGQPQPASGGRTGWWIRGLPQYRCLPCRCAMGHRAQTEARASQSGWNDEPPKERKRLAVFLIAAEVSTARSGLGGEREDMTELSVV